MYVHFIYIVLYRVLNIYIYIYIYTYIYGIIFLFRSLFFRLHSVVNFIVTSFVVLVAVEFLHYHRRTCAHSDDRPQRDRRPRRLHLRY